MSNKIDILILNPRPLQTFPFGLGLLLAILKKANLKASIINVSLNKENASAAVTRIAEINPKIICFTGFLLDFAYIKEISNLAKKKIPAIKQVAGGWWSNAIPDIVFDETSVDYIVRGEGDHVISDLCRSLIEGTSIPDLPGVCHRKGEKGYCIKEPTGFPSKMDELPLPAYDLFDMSAYMRSTDRNLSPFTMLFKNHERYKRFGKKKTFRWFPMYSGRGCYGKCAFCSMAGSVRRNHSPKYVVDHMEKMQKEYNIDVFDFTESLTLTTKAWVKDFCREILKRGLVFLYVPFCRGDFIYDDETISLLSQSGCHAVRFGFESGDDEMLTKMGKRVSSDQYCTLINKLHEYEIHVSGSFIFNMPGETKKSLDNTVKFLEKSRLPNFDYGFATPYPQTALYEYAKQHGFIQDERDYLIEYLAKPRKATNRINRRYIDNYISKFNFNDISANDFLSTVKSFERLEIINRAYYKNRFFFHVFKMIPALASGVIVLLFLKKVFKFLFVETIISPRKSFQKLSGKFRELTSKD